MATMSNAEVTLRRILTRRGKIEDEQDDKGLLAWLHGLIYQTETVQRSGGRTRTQRIMENCHTPLERRIYQRLRGEVVDPTTQLQQRMG